MCAKVHLMGDLVGGLAGMLTGAVLAALWGKWLGAPQRRRVAGGRWSQRHLAYVAPQWVPDVDRQLTRNLHLQLAAMAIMCGGTGFLSRGAGTFVLSLATVPALLVLARGVDYQRAVLPPGPRIARLREPTLSDYLSQPRRLVMWASPLVVGTITVVGAVRRDSPLLVVPAVVLLAGVVWVEAAGARLARRPEPAIDPAHLYWQDAFRVDAVRAASGMAAVVAVATALYAPAIVGAHGAWTHTYQFIATPVLLLTALLLSRSNKRPVDHLRSRLWPTLTRDQVLMPGEPIPSRVAAS